MARRAPPPPALAPKCCTGFSACLGDQAGAAALGTPPLGELRLRVLSTASMSPPKPANSEGPRLTVSFPLLPAYQSPATRRRW
jgi:hypothetical protein